MKSAHKMAMTLAALFLAVNGTVRASETDDRIESSFKKSYAYQTYLHDDAIMARSKDGNVVLKGKVSEESHKDLAGETMASLPGVKSVDNRLIVKGRRPVKNSDKWIHMKVKTALLFHRSVNAHKTDVAVKSGVVTLSGQAENQAQKDLTSEYAMDVQGVKDVKNEMAIVQAMPSLTEKMIEKIDDASITAQVKISLLSRRSTSALSTQVKTEEGVVTISGKAGNAAEKALVTKLASDINGVKSVVNDMVVSPTVSKS